MVETLYRGGKGDFLEGGVRMTAQTRWPGVIAERQIVSDIIHETDLFTTFANLAGAKKYISTDRIIDGIDQTATPPVVEACSGFKRPICPLCAIHRYDNISVRSMGKSINRIHSAR